MPEALTRVVVTNLKRALDKRNLEAASALIAQLLELEPLSLETRGLELEYFILSGRLNEAANLGQQLLTQFPQSSRIVFLNGLIAYKHKLYAKAAAYFKESHQLYPHWRSKRFQGKALTQLGNFEEARGLLEAVEDRAPLVLKDLAWLYERWGDPGRAMQYVEAYLKHFPEDDFMRKQLLTLRARSLDPDQLRQEVETMEALGEEVDLPLVAVFLGGLLNAGDFAAVRAFVARDRARWTPAVSIDVAWKCHHAQLYDLAFDLFLFHGAGYVRNPKFLKALEKDAKLCHRVPQLLEAYAQWAVEFPNLYGRLKGLAAQLK